ncbi:unnamed protein product [Cuscuta epithymum]|uniref:Pentatricopeptide repeat-containing protein n=1 Tax=Cuscuta epithymum TaxID=186058 RepID=A0AAV0DC54_9ASTE|nr:unnamed protein product [Cuscuta epithymum]
MATSSRALLSFAKRFSTAKNCSKVLSLSSEIRIEDDATVTYLCSSFQRSRKWESLARELSFINLTTPLVNKVLLSFKDKDNATKALNFFHWSSKSAGFSHGVQTYCITVHILAKAWLIKDAKALIESVFTKLDNSDVFTVLGSLLETYKTTDSVPFVFDLFVQVCSKLRLTDKGFNICKVLDDNGFLLSVFSYNALLHVLQKSKKHGMVWDIYGHMIEKRVNPNLTTVETMVNAMCKEGRLQWFVDVVGKIHRGKRCGPGVVVNTCLIHGIIEDGRMGYGLKLLKRMLQKNMIIDTVSYSLIVFAKVKMGDLDCAWEVYDEMLKRGFQGNAFVYDAFITSYCEKGRVDDAIEILGQMESLDIKPLVETFEHLMKSCSNAGRVNESLDFCKKMVLMGFVPSCLAFNVMVEKLCENGIAKEADQMLTELLDKGFVPDQNTYSHLLAGYAKEGSDIEGALKLYYEMKYRSISLNSSSFSWLIIGLLKVGRLSEAHKFLRLMKAECFTFSSSDDKLISSQLLGG